MLRLVSSSQALSADRRAEEHFGYPPWMLMEEAGIRLQAWLEWEHREALDGVVYLAGSGNNAGDAYAMARHAHLRGYTVAVVRVFHPSSPSCLLQAQLAESVGLPVLERGTPEALQALRRARLWVDGLWGTGLNAPLRADRAEALAALEVLRAEVNPHVVAIDVPSGLWSGWTSGQPVLQATTTLTPGWLKDFFFFPGCRRFVGRAVRVALSFPESAALAAQGIEPDDLQALLPVLHPEDHKRGRGHVALIGGDHGMTGALVLAARSSAAAGAGLVSLFLDGDLVTSVAASVPAFQVRALGEFAAHAQRYQAAVVGPGWGRHAHRGESLRTLLETDLPLVLDADALVALAMLPPHLRRAPTVITPHAGEFCRLSGQPEPTVEGAQALAEARGVTVVLKGAVTWIVSPDGRRAVWDGQNPTLGTGGSGDCLAGIVGSFLAAGQDGFDAGCAAVALHGCAGRVLAREMGWYTAEQLPVAVSRLATCRISGQPL